MTSPLEPLGKEEKETLKNIYGIEEMEWRKWMKNGTMTPNTKLARALYFFFAPACVPALYHIENQPVKTCTTTTNNNLNP
mmetsp:Transcript_14283/g.36002  ORF Transcript_14283/g.36002 Transcript_14283/m.36002 type:complete len:80 (+) Transcript_14283:2203-2442(+)